VTAGTAAHVVAIGGGHGLSRVLAALRRHDADLSAVVTVADDGGSSGRLRRELGVLPPGDLRMALLALARNEALADVLAHRFSAGALAPHALGNLLLVALAEQAGGDFLAALERAATLLDCAGRVLPATLDPVSLRARIAGRHVEGQVSVMHAGGPVEAIWLDPPDAMACEPAVEAVAAADVLVLGPGSLFTSVIAPLLVPGLAAAVAASPARTVYVANLRTQPGETSGMDLADHVDALRRFVPGLQVDDVVVHDGPEGFGRVVRADLVERRPDGSPGGGHDADRLAAALGPLLQQAADRRPAVDGAR
jgi:uncharacterized cofD-like protein